MTSQVKAPAAISPCLPGGGAAAQRRRASPAISVSGTLRGTRSGLTARLVLEESKYLRFLLLNRPFLFQPHGNLSDSRTWVLGFDARNKLLSANKNYREWISHLLATRRLVIVGFRPRDFSFESLLLEDFRSQLQSRRVDHFWIVPDPQEEDRLWASNYHIKLIPYSPRNNQHPEVLEILNQLATYKPREPQPGVAYQGPTIDISDLPPDDELRKYPLQDIRARLNAALAGATNSITAHEAQLEFMASFMQKFSASVHMAWHMKPESYDSVWGYRLTNELGEGGFGHVWKVEDVVDGQVYAMKVLHESVIAQQGFLEAFRRGVRAMRILGEEKVSGMVKYIKAFDIPSCVVMEFIDGRNLEDAIESNEIDSLQESLSVVKRVGEIVLSGHELDRQVLHRDLKPANVMLRNFYNSDAQREVVVLDFDLSWYEGAMGRSMMHGARLHNYIAPEQVIKKPGVSSRHTAVDVFGLGMLLCFAATGRHPEINSQNTIGFKDTTATAIWNRWDRTFSSIPEYLALIIEAATVDDQARRPAMPQLIKQIDLALDALTSGRIKTPSDLANLELAIPFIRGGWNSKINLESLQAISLTRNECTVTMGFHDSVRGLVHRTELFYSHGGGVDWSRVRKYGKTKRDRAVALLRRENIFERVQYDGEKVVTITVETNLKSWTTARIGKISAVLLDAADALAFVDQ